MIHFGFLGFNTSRTELINFYQLIVLYNLENNHWNWQLMNFLGVNESINISNKIYTSDRDPKDISREQYFYVSKII
jgi:hypothetical protein